MNWLLEKLAQLTLSVVMIFFIGAAVGLWVATAFPESTHGGGLHKHCLQYEEQKK